MKNINPAQVAMKTAAVLGCSVLEVVDVTVEREVMIKHVAKLNDELRNDVEAEYQRAEAEWQRAEVERQRAEAERQRAEAERQRAEAARTELLERMDLVDELCKEALQYGVTVAKGTTRAKLSHRGKTAFWEANEATMTKEFITQVKREMPIKDQFGSRKRINKKIADLIDVAYYNYITMENAV